MLIGSAPSLGPSSLPGCTIGHLLVAENGRKCDWPLAFSCENWPPPARRAPAMRRIKYHFPFPRRQTDQSDERPVDKWLFRRKLIAMSSLLEGRQIPIAPPPALFPSFQRFDSFFLPPRPAPPPPSQLLSPSGGLVSRCWPLAENLLVKRG